MSSGEWSGRKVTQARAALASRTTWPVPCGQCGKPVQREDRWALGHIKSRASYPELTWVPSNWAVEHRECSDAGGQRAVIEKAKLEARKSLEASDFSATKSAEETPPLPISLRDTSGPIQTRTELLWTPAALSGHKWLSSLLAVPGDAAPPSAMTPVHPEAVGSYGPQAVEWIEDRLKVRLRWWQRLSLCRILEHREDGSLVWRTILLSASRRSGKSVLLRGLCLWRMAHGHVITSEVSTCLHTGADVAVCREVQRGAWQYADAAGWKVSKANGKEAIESPDGARWLVRAQNAVYGYEGVALALVDEAWDTPASVVDDGLDPAILERESPQLLLTSTAHRKATTLMRSRISSALATEDGETLLLLWAAPADADLADPAVWRAASPHWSEDRHRVISAKHLAATNGTEDAELGDDPVETFRSQYLNVWNLNARRAAPGTPLLDASSWQTLTTPQPTRTPDAAAIESWFEDGCSLAVSWQLEDGPSVTHVEGFPSLQDARTALDSYGFGGTVLVGASLATDPALRGLRTKPTNQRVTSAVSELSRLLAEDAVRHTGTEHLDAQILAVRTAPGPDGLRLTSRHRADALKAACWSATAARKPSKGRPRILTASA